MHSDVAQYIAYSGEFFIRKLPGSISNSDAGGTKKSQTSSDPRSYELVIDNNSGTYRPDKDLLPQLKDFLEYNFAGLSIKTLAEGDEELDELKEKQRKKKKDEGNNRVFVQNSHFGHDSDSSISSSDEDDLNGLIQASKSSNKKEKKSKGLADRVMHPKTSLLDWARKETKDSQVTKSIA